MTSFIIGVKILSSLAWGILSLWSRSFTIRVVNSNLPDLFAAEKRTVIYAFWHSNLFLLPYVYRNSDIVIMVSESRDGEVVTGILKHFGLKVVRGSSKRKGTKGLIGLIRNLQKGRSVAMAVDGPRGPRHEVKEGAVFLAGKSGAPIIPVATGARRYWTLEKTWDKFVVPAPFTEGVIQFGEPITVSGTSAEEIESKRRELESTLEKLTSEAAEHAAASRKGERSVTRNERSFSKSSR
jgi:lysophospholipid acyltransferase (LPLAT)-like uncharacterized protein